MGFMMLVIGASVQGSQGSLRLRRLPVCFPLSPTAVAILAGLFPSVLLPHSRKEQTAARECKQAEQGMERRLGIDARFARMAFASATLMQPSGGMVKGVIAFIGRHAGFLSLEHGLFHEQVQDARHKAFLDGVHLR